MIPQKLKGSEFEKALVDWSDREEKLGRLTMGRYGVDGVTFGGKTMLVPSKPDFEGVLIFPLGRQFIVEAKVAAGSAFEMRKEKIKPRQVAHMLTRSRFGALCFLVIHFTARRLSAGTDAAFTIAIPVTDAEPRWQAFVDAYALAKRTKQPVVPQGSISRALALEMGTVIAWTVPKRCTKAIPDLLPILDPTGRLRTGENQPLELFLDNPTEQS